MARPQAADYAERRAAIVEQAARLYAREGFRGASVADLAEACGLSKAAIYHYYSSKEDILFDVMHSHVLALDAAAREVAHSKVSPAEKLSTLTHAFMRLYVGARDRHKVLLNELDNLPKGKRTIVVGLQRGLIETVEEILVGIAPRLKRKSPEALAAAMLYFGMINWTHTWFDPKGPLSAGALAEMVVELTLGGLGRAG